MNDLHKTVDITGLNKPNPNLVSPCALGDIGVDICWPALINKKLPPYTLVGLELTIYSSDLLDSWPC
jgi:hypothetical protein